MLGASKSRAELVWSLLSNKNRVVDFAFYTVRYDVKCDVDNWKETRDGTLEFCVRNAGRHVLVLQTEWEPIIPDGMTYDQLVKLEKPYEEKQVLAGGYLDLPPMKSKETASDYEYRIGQAHWDLIAPDGHVHGTYMMFATTD